MASDDDPADDLDAVADRLYALPPEEFTAARDNAAKQAGDKRLRAQVKALRRPTVSAWLVNLLAQEQPELLEQVLALGPALAQAQAEGSGDALRQLGQQRRELVAAVTGTAVGLADREVPAAARTEVEQTLEAALADPATADAVRSGRLVRALSYAGFGGVDLDGAVATPTTKQKAPPRKNKREQTDDGLEPAALAAAAALDDAVRACEAAERDRETARQQAEAAGADAAAAADEVARLETELAGARRRSAAATTAASAAAQRARAGDTAAERARTAVSAAQEQAEQARAVLDRARRG